MVHRQKPAGSDEEEMKQFLSEHSKLFLNFFKVSFITFLTTLDFSRETIKC